VPQANLAGMSIDALLKLRADVDKTLSRRADELRDQLSRLGSRAVGEPLAVARCKEEGYQSNIETAPATLGQAEAQRRFGYATK
jgi:hypothetical protein